MLDNDLLKYFAELVLENIFHQDSSRVKTQNRIYEKLNSFPNSKK